MAIIDDDVLLCVLFITLVNITCLTLFRIGRRLLGNLPSLSFSPLGI